ncbi:MULTISPECIES: flagellar motor switch protein FliN [unclassified Beijerinckia]|uniref:flagellar motor switch protein FliN n=1 Tax=unclassified Beijerinckia TaxID=2638183 RepID=UPI000894FD8D|nr:MULTISPECIES: flagellar motor switch protein FliN [unclassified Beijerinckia]MDH7798681.1 flagellar motor switch protein FliN/FliY [Beijerinckia sp. GAS462]SED29214.1 flagellar motor switch protein FliN/FliY [Beijerinckia sp. 28-YEA-48]
MSEIRETSGVEIRPPNGENPEPGSIDHILQIPVRVDIVLGSTTMPVTSLMKLGRGAVVLLDQRVGDPVDVVVNGRIVARGELVVAEENGSRIGISLTEIVGSSSSV